MNCTFKIQFSKTEVLPRYFYQMLAFTMRSNKICVKDIYIHDKFNWYSVRRATSKGCNKDERIGSGGKIIITKILSLSYENKSTRYINPNRKNQLEIYNPHCNHPVLTNFHEQIIQSISRKNIWKSLKQKNCNSPASAHTKQTQ